MLELAEHRRWLHDRRQNEAVQNVRASATVAGVPVRILLAIWAVDLAALARFSEDLVAVTLNWPLLSGIFVTRDAFCPILTQFVCLSSRFHTIDTSKIIRGR